MTDEKTPADRALDLLVFAPMGLALSVRELLPELVERGRRQVDGQVNLARMIGQMAVKQGTVEAEKAFVRAREQAQQALEQLGALDGRDRAAPPAASVPVPTPSPAAPPTPEPAPGPRPVPVRDERTTAPASAAPALAVPDYDSLSASQVVPRLSSLDPDELEAVRVHEAANRGRKTILGKIAQLQAS